MLLGEVCYLLSQTLHLMTKVISYVINKLSSTCFKGNILDIYQLT